MLHLSLVTLLRSSLRWQILQPYQLHQVLWWAFRDAPQDRTEKRFLYRHEISDRAHSILVQSANKPEWEFLQRMDGASVQTRSFNPTAIAVDQRLRFFLRANPVTKRQGYEDGKERHILVGSDRARMAERRGIALEAMPSREEQLVEWLQRKGEASGFALEQCMPGESKTYSLDRPRQKPTGDTTAKKERTSTSPMTFVGIDFEGIIRVTDQPAFLQALNGGIGRGKAFGFGLLSVARAL